MPSAKEEFDELMRDKSHRTSHPEDDARSFLDLSGDDDDDEDDAPPTPKAVRSKTRSRDSSDEDEPRPSMSLARNTIPNTRYGANTGPKGVISDAQNFRDSQRQHRRNQSSMTYLPQQAPPQTIPKVVDQEEDIVEDDEFMESWRRERLQKLQNGAHQSQMHQSRKRGRLWGSLQVVDAEGYLEAVDGSGSDTVVVVYIYDDTSEVSALLEDCVRDLARKHVDTRFIKLDFLEAEMEPAGVPALLAYRNGDMFSHLVPLMDEVPEDADVSATTMEVLLRRRQILR